MSNHDPDVTVLMTVYNGMPYIREAVDSVCAQTYPRWKMIVVDDGSTDETAAYLDALDDPRITVVHQENTGTAAAANNALDLCDTEFIARMDADDVCLPTRLEKQAAFLKTHPKVGLVGSNIVPLGSKKVGRPIPLATDHETIYAQLRTGRHAMCHPATFMRTELLKKIGGYWNQHRLFEDWDMFLRMGEVSELANLGETLLQYRIHAGSLNGEKLKDVQAYMDLACELARRRQEGLPPITSDEYFAEMKRRDVWASLKKNMGVYALLQYRLAMIDVHGGHPLRGYGRMLWSGICSPARVLNRLSRHAKPA